MSTDEPRRVPTPPPARKAEPVDMRDVAAERFWRILGRKVRAGAHIPDGYDARRPR